MNCYAPPAPGPGAGQPTRLHGWRTSGATRSTGTHRVTICSAPGRGRGGPGRPKTRSTYRPALAATPSDRSVLFGAIEVECTCETTSSARGEYDDYCHGSVQAPATNKRGNGPRELLPHRAQIPGSAGSYPQVLSSLGGWIHRRRVYLWESRERAEQFYTDDWKRFIEDAYGSKPSSQYFLSPVIERAVDSPRRDQTVTHSSQNLSICGNFSHGCVERQSINC